jgi:hypothetical protein
MSDDLIGNGDPTAPVIMGQIVLTLLAGPNGQPGNLSIQQSVDEIIARYMMSKAMATMEDHWRAQNAPKVIPVNGTTPMGERLRRHFRG